MFHLKQNGCKQLVKPKFVWEENLYSQFNAYILGFMVHAISNSIHLHFGSFLFTIFQCLCEKLKFHNIGMKYWKNAFLMFELNYTLEMDSIIEKNCVQNGILNSLLFVFVNIQRTKNNLNAFVKIKCLTNYQTIQEHIFHFPQYFQLLF